MMDTAMDGTAERREGKAFSPSPVPKNASAFLVIEEPCPLSRRDNATKREEGKEDAS